MTQRRPFKGGRVTGTRRPGAVWVPKRALLLTALALAVSMLTPQLVVTAHAASLRRALIAHAKKKKKTTAKRPSIKVIGISVNEQYRAPGENIKEGESTNGCYGAAGETGAPNSLTVVVFIEAISIPAQAKLTASIADPWGGAESAPFTGPFDQGFFTDRGHGVSSIFGGPQGKNDYYRYSDLPTGESTSYYLNGRYGRR